MLWSSTGFSQKTVVFQWLVGEWEINTGTGLIVEDWQTAKDSTLVGKSVYKKRKGYNPAGIT